MKKMGFASVEGMKGNANQQYADRLAAFERHNYMATVTSSARGAKLDVPEPPVDFTIQAVQKSVRSADMAAPDPEEDRP